MRAVRTAFTHRPSLRTLSLLAMAIAALPVVAEPDIPRRCVMIDVFAEKQDAATVAAIDGITAFAASRDGVVVVRRFPDINENDRDDLRRLAAQHGFDPLHLPIVSVCDVVIVQAQDPRAVVVRLREALDFTVFTREGCQRCSGAKVWLGGISKRYPAFDVSTADIGHDEGARTLLADMVRRRRIAAASVPVFSFGGRLEVGFDRAETSGKRLEALLEKWTRPCVSGIDGSSNDRSPAPEPLIALP